MDRLPRILSLLAAAGIGGSGVMAQPAPAPYDSSPPASSPAASATPPAAAAPTTPTPAKPRAISSATAAMLAATMPKYDPPKPVKPTPQAEQPDLREIDKPKNGIIRLPKYVVRAQVPPIFREQDLYTKEGLNGVALKRYAGLNLGNFGDLNAPIALQMYQEDERLKSMADLDDTARTMSRGGDAAEGAYILRQSQDTYDRPMDWGGPVPGQPNSAK